MKTEFVAAAATIIGMTGGIVLMVIGGTGELPAMLQAGQAIVMFILGAVFGQNVPNIVRSIGHWLVSGKQP